MINKKINLVSLGCSKNLVDSENLMGQLENNGMQVVFESDKASDIVIINTCGFINDAKEESINTILNFVKAKNNGLVEKIIVMGCLSERYREDLIKEIPEIDSIFGVDEMDKILESLQSEFKENLIGERKLSTPNHYAYLKVSEGCDRTCAFCAIPLIRGKHKSRTIEDILTEANKLAQKGVKELILIAQDLTYYGVDIYKKKSLAELIDKLSDIEGVKWIRLHYTYPTQFPDDVLDLMAKKSNICNYIDIPLQHISDGILKSMNRKHNSKNTRELIKKFRAKVPNVAVRSTFIVGFPGETQKDFEELKDFIKESRFSRLGVFTYSPEENTAAFDLKDDVPAHVKLHRMRAIMEIQEQISLELNTESIGKTLEVVVDSETEEFYVGRTEFDSPEVDNEVLIKKTSEKLEIGNFYKAKVIAAENFDIFAELIK